MGKIQFITSLDGNTYQMCDNCLVNYHDSRML